MNDVMFLRQMHYNRAKRQRRKYNKSGVRGSGMQVVNHPYAKLANKLNAYGGGNRTKTMEPPKEAASGQQLKTDPAANTQGDLKQQPTFKMKDVAVLPKKRPLKQGPHGENKKFQKRRKKIQGMGMLEEDPILTEFQRAERELKAAQKAEREFTEEPDTEEEKEEEEETPKKEEEAPKTEKKEKEEKGEAKLSKKEEQAKRRQGRATKNIAARKALEEASNIAGKRAQAASEAMIKQKQAKSKPYRETKAAGPKEVTQPEDNPEFRRIMDLQMQLSREFQDLMKTVADTDPQTAEHQEAKRNGEKLYLEMKKKAIKLLRGQKSGSSTASSRSRSTSVTGTPATRSRAASGEILPEP